MRSKKIDKTWMIILLFSTGLFFDMAFGPGLGFCRVEINPAMVKNAHTEVELIPEFETVSPGTDFWIGLRMRMDPQWHTYWKNPGDSGLATSIEWELPTGFQASEIFWPQPERIDIPPLTSYGYEGEILLLTKMVVPKMIPQGQLNIFKAHITWLACKIECLPGQATFDFSMPTVPLRHQSSQHFQNIYDANIMKFPRNNMKIFSRAMESPETVRLMWDSKNIDEEDPQKVEFFPERADVIDHASRQMYEKEGNQYSLLLTKSAISKGKRLKKLDGLLIFERTVNGQNTRASLSVRIPLEWEEISYRKFSSQRTQNPIVMLCFAFLGGMILNLMPCVLPVLSIKILSLVAQAKENEKKLFFEGLLFSLGIILSFWFLAGFMLILRFAGKQVGWGFQFQSPFFIIFMSVLFYWLALNLLGVFEIGTSVARLEETLKRPFMLRNSFFNGVLATIVATPCTAPFMGTALGYAIVQPVWMVFVIFFFLGLGMAAPYLIISRFPHLLRFIPKQGPWMLTLKRIFGFFFLATVVWLSQILGAQSGVNAMTALYTAFLIMGVSGWMIGYWAVPANPSHIRWMARIVAIGLFIFAIMIALRGITTKDSDVQERQNKKKAAVINWIAYSPELLDELKEQNNPIFIDFTATWCLTCQVNERLVLDHPKIFRKFKELGVVAIKADWTNFNDQITEALASYGKTSIPFYILLKPGMKETPIVLPELLTVGIVLKFLEKLVI